MFDYIHLKDEDDVFRDKRVIDTIHLKITPKERYIIDYFLTQFVGFQITKSAYIRGLIDRDIRERLESGFFDLRGLTLEILDVDLLEYKK